MSISRGTRFRILTRDGFRCRYCGREAPGVELEVDHIHPVSRGGTDDDENLVAACFDCNRGKHTRILPRLAPIVVTEPRIDTVPHPDVCRRCRPFRYCAAIAEAPSGPGHFLAVYECRCGQRWRTSWSDEPAHRIMRADIDALLADLNEGAAWAATRSTTIDSWRSH